MSRPQLLLACQPVGRPVSRSRYRPVCQQRYRRRHLLARQRVCRPVPRHRHHPVCQQVPRPQLLLPSASVSTSASSSTSPSLSPSVSVSTSASLATSVSTVCLSNKTKNANRNYFSSLPHPKCLFCPTCLQRTPGSYILQDEMPLRRSYLEQPWLHVLL